MSNFKSFVERTIHVQLQQFTRFQTTVPLFAALVVFSSFPFVGRTSPTSVSALAAPLRKALTKRSAPEGVPFLTSLFNIFARALNTACLRARVHVKIPLEWRHMFARARPRRDDTYATPRAEAQYWRIADRYRRRLYSGSGTAFMPSTPSSASRDDMVVPLVTYYTPRLLPLYRDHTGGKRTPREVDVDACDARISPRTFCKWHRMVFQDSCHHPTLAQAAVQMKYYSNRDLREMQRIARLVPDEEVFGPKGKRARKAKRSTKYSDMWQNWLENKGVDLVIVFE